MLKELKIITISKHNDTIYIAFDKTKTFLSFNNTKRSNNPRNNRRKNHNWLNLLLVVVL